jgi:hypothetical protein
MNSKKSRADTHNRQSNLTTAEEDAIVQYILDPDTQGFSPWRCDVEDIANLLLVKRDA